MAEEKESKTAHLLNTIDMRYYFDRAEATLVYVKMHCKKISKQPRIKSKCLADGSPWFRSTDKKTGRPLYFNEATGHSQWERPNDIEISKWRQIENESTFEGSPDKLWKPLCSECSEEATIFCLKCKKYFCLFHGNKVHQFSIMTLKNSKHIRTIPNPPKDHLRISKSQQIKGTLHQIKNQYRMMVSAIVRPPRADYEMEELGPEEVILESGHFVVRHDFRVLNPQGLNIVGSEWTASPRELSSDDEQNLLRDTCVLYLHGNSSCRQEVIKTGVIQTVIFSGLNLVAIDFSGSGKSDGDFVSLGWFEHFDINTILGYMKQRGYNKFVLWGRSMGAASTLMYMGDQLEFSKDIIGLILDSSFISFQTLARDLGRSQVVKVPKIAMSTVYSSLRRSVRKRANFDLNRLEPISGARTSTIPAIFFHGESDVMIPFQHGVQLHENYVGPSLLLNFEGGHNSPRPFWIHACIQTFLNNLYRQMNLSVDEVFSVIQQIQHRFILNLNQSSEPVFYFSKSTSNGNYSTDENYFASNDESDHI